MSDYFAAGRADEHPRVYGSGHESGQASDDRADRVHVLDVLLIMAKHKRLILLAPLVVGVLAAGLSLLLPNLYTATAKILPPQQSQSSASAMLAQLGSVASLIGGGSSLKNPSELYVGMLKSRTVADSLVERFDLQKRYDVKYRSLARQQLEQQSALSLGKDGIIAIEVTAEDPKFAAELANGYVDELFKLTQVLALTEASQRRLFFEQQFNQAKKSLAVAETQAREALQQGGLVKVDEQGRAMVETSARLRAQMAAKEVQIGAMRTFAAEGNPELRLAREELDAMRRELAKLEGAGDARAGMDAGSAKGMSNISLLRNLKYHEVLFELLARQYEMSKIDEAKESTVVQVLDKAIEPDRKSRPKRAAIVVFAAAAALLGAILWAFVREAIGRMAADPEGAARLDAFRHLLSWRRVR